MTYEMTIQRFPVLVYAEGADRKDRFAHRLPCVPKGSISHSQKPTIS